MTDGSVPRVLGAELALAAVRMWAQAGELWEGRVVRDSWRAVVEAERAAGIQQPGTAAASYSSRGAAGGGESSWRRRLSAAVAALRHQLAAVEAAEAEARAGSGAGLADRAGGGAGAEAVSLADAAGASTSTAVGPAVVAAAAPAAAAEAAHGGVALVALEVEAAAEHLPPLSRMATAELCCRLAAAAMQTLTGGAKQQRRLEAEGARGLVWASLKCWRRALAPERTCPRRPAPPEVVKRLERWWRVALRALAAEECTPAGCLGLAPEVVELMRAGWGAVELMRAGWGAAGSADRVLYSLYCGPCLGEFLSCNLGCAAVLHGQAKQWQRTRKGRDPPPTRKDACHR